MKFRIPESVTRTVATTVLKTQKNSPTILFGAGIGLGLATVVTACKATLKLEGVLEDAQKDKADAGRLLKENEAGLREDYPEQDHNRDMIHIYIRTAVRITKLYAPSAVLGVVSVACLTKSHRILTSRNTALTAAYAAVDRAFKEYRARVKDQYGEEKEREIYYDVQKRELEVPGLNGEVKTKSRRIAGAPSQYARMFSQDSTSAWSSQPEYNLAFLRLQQNHLNDRLKARGHVLLNDAYDLLGLSRTPAGTQVGWLWNKGGDDYIDFGIWTNQNMDGTISYLTGFEDEIMLDFNVDGPIWKSVQ